MKTSSLSNLIILLFAAVIILIYGKMIMVPFMLALLFYFLIRAVRRFIDRNKIVREHIPSWLKNVISGIVIYSIIGFLFKIMFLNSQNLIASLPNYEQNLHAVLDDLVKNTGIDVLKMGMDGIKSFDLALAFNNALNLVSSFLGNLMLVLFYIIFLFIEESSFNLKLRTIFKGEKFNEIEGLLDSIEHSITQYLGLKSLVSFISAFGCYLILLGFGVQSPLFWAFLVFIMNFIPIIGPLLGVILPVFFAIMQFGEFKYPLIMMLSMGGLQTLISNFIEPKIMGDSLNISPLVAVLALAVWGTIWGIIGMVVSVPITVILIIILAKFPKTKPIAILLSNNGKV